MVSCARIGVAVLVGLSVWLGVAATSAAAPVGALAQLPGAQGCVRVGGGLGCARGRAFGSATDVAVSPDGRNVYAVGDGVAVFARDQVAGGLRQLRGRAGCVGDRGFEGCGLARAMEENGGLTSVSVAPDGRHVYVASLDGTVVVLARDPARGRLRHVRGRARCVTLGGQGGCARGRALGAVTSVRASSDGRNVYVTSVALGSMAGNAIAVFARDQGSGALRQLPGRAGCVSRRGRGGCARGRGLWAANAASVSADGRNVYVASADLNAPGGEVAVFERDQVTGALRQLAGPAGCVSQPVREGCAPGRAIKEASGVAVSAEGRNVYAIGSGGAVFARDPATGELHQLPGQSRCLRSGGGEGCAPARLPASATSLTVGPEGSNVYVAGVTDSGSDRVLGEVAVFARDPQTGALGQLPGQTGCVSQRGRRGCAPSRALDLTFGMAASPDARSLYTVSTDSDFGGELAVFARSIG